MSLSDKINHTYNGYNAYDVKEFIKELKEELKSGLIADKRYNGIRLRINYLIDKLAGDLK